MFCDTFSETSKIMKFSILAQNMIFSMGADMAQNQYILIQNMSRDLKKAFSMIFQCKIVF